jgi:Ankyrin repeats (many copies)
MGRAAAGAKAAVAFGVNVRAAAGVGLVVVMTAVVVPLGAALLTQPLDLRHEWALTAHWQLAEAVASHDLGRVRAWLLVARDEPSAEWALPLLVIAAEHGDADIVCELLAHGLDPNARAKDGTSALEAARARGHDATAELLISAGAR